MASNLKYDILIWSVGNVTALYNVSRKDCFPGLSPATGINLQNFHGNINRYFCWDWTTQLSWFCCLLEMSLMCGADKKADDHEAGKKGMRKYCSKLVLVWGVNCWVLSGIKIWDVWCPWLALAGCGETNLSNKCCARPLCCVSLLCISGTRREYYRPQSPVSSSPHQARPGL